MKNVCLNICLNIFLIVFLCAGIYAHGPIHESIARVSKAIEEDPGNPGLYIERGQYHQVDKNFDKAFADYEKARTLEPANVDLDYHCAKLFSEHAYPHTALLYANRFLVVRPEHVRALMARAAIYTQLKQDSLAILDFELAIEYTTEPRPEFYADIAKATLDADSTDYMTALKWLEKGEDRLGFNIILRTKAIDIALAQRDYDKAITVIDGILEKFTRKEKWLFKKAEILELASQPSLARKNYLEAEAAIKKLPERHRRTRMVMELEAKIILAMEKLNGQH